MKYNFWFIVGSQHLYGEEVLKEVAKHGQIMTDGFNARITSYNVCYTKLLRYPHLRR